MIPAGERQRERGTLALLLLLCLCGAAMRFTGLDTQSLWLDELASWSQSSQPSVAGVIARVREDVHVPLHGLLLHAVQLWGGDSEIWLRLPSAVAGVLAIPALYAFVRRLYGPREGLFAAVLLTFGETPIYYSQAARPYALLVLFSCVSGTFWLGALRALRAQASLTLATRIGFAASAIATAYIHYFGTLLTALQCLALLAFGSAPARAARLIAPVALAGLPWLSAFAEDADRDRFWIREPQIDVLLDTWMHLFRRPEYLWWISAALCALLLGRRAAHVARTPTPAALRALPDSPTFLALLWLACPPALAFVASKLWLPIYTTRNLLVVLPAAYALTARAITELFPGERAQRIAALVLAATLFTGTVFTGHYYTSIRHSQHRELAAAFAWHEAEAPDALALSFGARAEHFDYYLRRFGLEGRIGLEAQYGTDEVIEAALRALDARRPAKLWLLAVERIPPAALLSGLGARYEPRGITVLDRAWLILLARRGDAHSSDPPLR